MPFALFLIPSVPLENEAADGVDGVKEFQVGPLAGQCQSKGATCCRSVAFRVAS